MLHRLVTRLRHISTRLRASMPSTGNLEDALHQAHERLELTQTATGLTSWEWRFATDEMIWTAGRPNLMVLGPDPKLRFSDVLAGVHPEDRVQTREAAYRSIAEGVDFHREFRVTLQNGNVRWILSRGKVFRNAAGTPDRMLGVNMDISDRKQVETDLLAEKDRFRSIFEQSAVGIAYVRARGKGTIRLANQTFCDMLGYRPDELEPKVMTEMIHPDDRDAEAELRERFAASQDRTVTAQRHYLRKDGSSFMGEVNVSVVTVPSENEPMAVHIVKDISLRIAAERHAHNAVHEMQRARDAADSANSAKSRFLANVSHEIRTPLTAILGFSELLLQSELSAAKRSRYKDVIARNGRLLNRLIDDLLDLSKIEANRLDLDLRDTSLMSLIEDVRQTFAPLAAEKNLMLRISAGQTLPSTISTDAAKLKQILLNLVGNAVKFTDKGSVELEIATSFGGFESATDLLFVVSDTGVGVPVEKQGQLFEPFSQPGGAANRLFGGTGLGLALSKRLAQLFGGDLYLLSSQVGKGSTFIARLPVNPRDARGTVTISPVAEDMVTAMEKEDPRIGGTRILLVEDSPDSQEYLTLCLTNDGAEVVLAVNGVEAVEKAVNGDFSLILMDVQLPLMDGLTATRELRRRGYKRPIVALTAHAMTHERERCLSAGCDEHVTKPIGADDLVRVVLKHLPD